jgi:transcriptional regulator with XRE-family HTH domain
LIQKMKMETGKLIKELRIKKGMTQEELADKTEVSARTIQRIENGEVDPRAYTLQMIAKALEIDFSVFTDVSSDEEKDLDMDRKRTWLALIHLSGLLPLFFPTIMIWNRKKADIKEITEHYRAVIAFQSMILFICVIGLWRYIRNDSPEVIFVILPIGVLFSIWNALKVLNGKPYKYFGIFRAKKNRT